MKKYLSFISVICAIYIICITPVNAYNETNITAFQEFTYPYDESPATITGLINTSTTVNLQMQGNVSTITRIQGLDIIIQSFIVIIVELTIIMITLILIFIKMLLSKRSVC